MEYFSIYADFLKAYLKPKRPIKVVMDCSNGTVGLVLESLFADKHWRETVLLNKNPDGNFPAHGPNPLASGAADELARVVVDSKADLGAIFDADGDRVFFVDNLGRKLDPAAAAILLAENFKGGIVLPANVGPFVRKELSRRGHETLNSRVGHYFLKKVMREKDLDFGAEQSGHFYFKKFFGLDSGIFAAIESINSVSGLTGKLSDWVDTLSSRWISEETNFLVADKKKAILELQNRYAAAAVEVSDLDGLSFQFSDWWFNVRPSNTEDLLRLNLEADNQKLFNLRMKEIADLLSGIKY